MDDGHQEAKRSSRRANNHGQTLGLGLELQPRNDLDPKPKPSRSNKQPPPGRLDLSRIRTASYRALRSGFASPSPLLTPTDAMTPRLRSARKLETLSTSTKHASTPSTYEKQRDPTNVTTPNVLESPVIERRKNRWSDSAPHTQKVIQGIDFSLDNVIPPEPTSPRPPNPAKGFFDLSRRDRNNFLVLVLLYLLQGIPMGLAMGSIPFLLKSHMSYGQIGIYTLAAYPYSLKLFWSPIVDAVWSKRVGRRLSWILPIQTISGLSMIWLGTRVDSMMIEAGADGGSGIWHFTLLWFALVFMCATQDIAVDGWAITLLSPHSLSYASTAQTVGLTAGNFLSFTVFLAFNSKEFANKWLRSTPQEVGIATLSGYLTFWGWTYLAVTLALGLLKREDKERIQGGIKEVYVAMAGVLQLKSIQTVVIIHLIGKIGWAANEAVTSLKLIDKGFRQEDLALTNLIDFPIEIGLGYYAGKWSEDYGPITLWCWTFVGRIFAALSAQLVVAMFPTSGYGTGYLSLIVLQNIFSTTMSTCHFVAVSAFHAKIADPKIGGTYMTLLATYVCHVTSYAQITDKVLASATLADHFLASLYSSLSTCLQSLLAQCPCRPRWPWTRRPFRACWRQTSIAVSKMEGHVTSLRMVSAQDQRRV